VNILLNLNMALQVKRKVLLDKLRAKMASDLHDLEMQCVQTEPETMSEELAGKCDRALSRRLRRIRTVEVGHKQAARERQAQHSMVGEDMLSRRAHKFANPSALETSDHIIDHVSSFLYPKEVGKLAIALADRRRVSNIPTLKAAQAALEAALEDALRRAQYKARKRAEEAAEKQKWQREIEASAIHISWAGTAGVPFAGPPVYTMRESLATLFERVGRRDLLPLVPKLAAARYPIDIASALTNTWGQHEDLMNATDKMRRKTKKLMSVLRSRPMTPPSFVRALSETDQGKQLMRHMTLDGGARAIGTRPEIYHSGVFGLHYDPRWWHELIA
jgi:hypothetical protein